MSPVHQAGIALNDFDGDRIFSGAQKSVAIGAPLAAIIFVPERAGLVILPLIFYHLAQLFLSAPVAVQLARDSD